MDTVDAQTTVSGVAVLSPAGRVNFMTAPQLRDELHAAVEAGSHRVLVDLSGVECLDSAGLGALISGLKTARAAGGDLRIAAPNQHVTTVLEVADLVRVFTPYESAEAALAGWA